jgi:cell division control protein 7
MCILACKFPIFTAGDDVEALMELAAVYGRKTMEKCGKLHSASHVIRILSRASALNPDHTTGRTFATNVRSVDHEEIPWPELVARINPHIYQLDPSASPSLFRGTTVTPPKTVVRGAVAPYPQTHSQSQSQPQRSKTSTLPLPSRASLQSPPPSQLQSQTGAQVGIPPTKHNRLINSALDLMSQCLHWDPTRRITSAEALHHPFLSEQSSYGIDADDDCEPEGLEGYDGGDDNGDR